MSRVVYEATEDQMEHAYAGARATFRFFWREMWWEHRRIIKAFPIACVKFAFHEAGQVEHMWVSDVDFDGERVRGVLMNEPNQLQNVHEGDAVDVPLERVEDWMIASRDSVLGAFTVHVLRAAMTASARQEHDAAWDLPFGDAERVTLPFTGDDHPLGPNMARSLDEYLGSNPRAIEEVDGAGMTMLHREAVAGNASLIGVLLARGASMQARTKSMKTPLALARAVGWRKVEQMLLEAGAKE
jgi:uncharacterized protein YegJ (DUF2314 family)